MKKLRILSEQSLLKRRAQLKAIADYYGHKLKEDDFSRILKAVKTRNTSHLTDEEQSDVWRIRKNLEDGDYVKSL